MPPPARPAVVHRGIILQVRNSGEGHRMVDIWLAGLGRTPLWARGARQSRRRFGASLSPFASVTVTVQPNPTLWTLQSAELNNDRLGIRKSLAQIGRAAALCRMVMALWPQGQDAPEVLDGLGVALDHLAMGRVARAAGLYPRLALWSGLLPDLDSCGECAQSEASDRPLAAVATKPHLVCRDCAPKAQPLAPAVRDALAGGRIADDAVATAVERVVTDWASLHAGRPLSGWMDEAIGP